MATQDSKRSCKPRYECDRSNPPLTTAHFLTLSSVCMHVGPLLVSLLPQVALSCLEKIAAALPGYRQILSDVRDVLARSIYLKPPRVKGNAHRQSVRSTCLQGYSNTAPLCTPCAGKKAPMEPVQARDPDAIRAAKTDEVLHYFQCRPYFRLLPSVAAKAELSGAYSAAADARARQATAQESELRASRNRLRWRVALGYGGAQASRDRLLEHLRQVCCSGTGGKRSNKGVLIGGQQRHDHACSQCVSLSLCV